MRRSSLGGGRDGVSAATLNECGESLSGLLKQCRARIGPENPSLGPYLRLPIRIGKAVSQEEVAETVGISRQWYWMMETDRAVRVSAAVLARMAEALMMAPAERAALFRLAVPELRSTPLSDRSTVFLDAFTSFRRLSLELWAASTEADVLTLVREHAMTELTPAVTVTYERVEQGRWDRAMTGNAYNDDRGMEFIAMIRERYGAAAQDDLYGYTLMAQPGELLIRDEVDARFPDLAAKARPALDAVGWGDLSFAMANVRSRRGFVGRLLAVHYRPHAYSELERAQLSTLAELASLALI